MEDIYTIRDRIDELDRQIVELLDKRNEEVLKAWEYKISKGSPIYFEEREKEILDNIDKMDTTVDKEFLKNLFKDIMTESRRVQDNL